MAYKDPEVGRARDRERSKARKRRGYLAPQIRYNMRRVNEIKEAAYCKDCGNSFPAICMDFDHLRDKVEEVSRLVANGCKWEMIETEIAKCDIVCSNCHRIRTQVRKIGGLKSWQIS